MAYRGEIAKGVYDSSAPTIPAGTEYPLGLDVNGNLKITGTVALAESVGALTWSAPVAVAMTGSSKTFVPADATRKALMMWSPAANAAAGIDIAGGTVVLAAAIQLSPGANPIVFSGPDTPAGIVTAIGTNTQSLYYQTGA